MSNGFLLLDLPSQSPAVQRLLCGRSDDEKLSWLSAQGRLAHVPMTVPIAQDWYVFESVVGLRCCFFIVGDEFVFISDYTTYTVRD